ncbi:MAG TPA: glycosyl hydrolase [Bacteroidales bacterium]|nr:glycosyl hydrolase [Bacteroidales bacterium]
MNHSNYYMCRKLFFILTVFLLVISCDDGVETETHINSFKQLKKHFKEVPNSYLPAPFWVWNSFVTKNVIENQLKDYASHGFGGVFVHPRYGLINEYGSERWYDLVAYTLKLGRRLDLDIWLYDENSYPSGFAGGMVPASMPSSFNRGHALKMHKKNQLSPENDEKYLLAYMQVRDSMVEITGRLDRYGERQGDYYLFEKVYYPTKDWYAGFSYVDLLMPGVTEKFIEITMTGYEDRFLLDFGRRVPGVFTDEPNIAPQGGRRLIRWTPDLFEQFERRWGYRLEPFLPALLEQIPGCEKVRHNYYQLLLELFIERWSVPWQTYTDGKQLLWTGHYWEHGWPSPHHGPDNMAMYAFHQVPGIDMLFNNWEKKPGQFGNIRAVRELNSVGNQLGKVRKLSETYGGSGWELTFEDMKRNADWQYVLGVNFLNQHLSYQSITGDRKHDYPPSFSYHAPYWDEYPVLNEYFGRLSLALSAGHQVNNVLVLEPTSSAWMYYNAGGDNSRLEELDRSFTQLLKTFEQEQVEYDLGSEYIIKQYGSVTEGLFHVGKRAYAQIVLPAYMDNINSETAELISDFLEGGGTVVAIGTPPERIDGERSTLFTEMPRNYKDQWFSVGSISDPRLIVGLRDRDIIYAESSGDSIYHMRRDLDGGQLLFFANAAKTEEASIRLNMEGKDIVELDLFDGNIYNYPCLHSDGILNFKVALKPAGSTLLYISRRNLHGQQRELKNWHGEGESIDDSAVAVSVLDDNVINLDYCKLIMQGDTSEKVYYYQAQEEVFRAHGFDKNPWSMAIQYSNEIANKDTFSRGSGFKAVYPFLIDSDFKTKDMRVVVESPELYKVTCNGEKLKQQEDMWWLDKDFGVYEIHGGIEAGMNELAIEAKPMSVYAELAPVYLVGDFDVLPVDEGWLLASSADRGVGSWRQMGLPFYSGRVEYTTTIDSVGMDVPVKLSLERWEGTVARIEVNGNLVGHVFSPPYEIRLDNLLISEKNTVSVIVYGSLKNLLGPHHNVNRRGIVTPWDFKTAPEDQPSGNAYDILDYGLMEPFRVLILSS